MNIFWLICHRLRHTLIHCAIRQRLLFHSCSVIHTTHNGVPLIYFGSHWSKGERGVFISSLFFFFLTTRSSPLVTLGVWVSEWWSIRHYEIATGSGDTENSLNSYAKTNFVARALSLRKRHKLSKFILPCTRDIRQVQIRLYSWLTLCIYLHIYHIRRRRRDRRNKNKIF